MIDHRDRLPVLLPNRVWRTYTGGRVLDQWEGRSQPADGSFPEDWIGSTVRAVNIGREQLMEGVSRVRLGVGEADLDALVAADPGWWLGPDAAQWGGRPPLLVKYLDSAIRLHFQVHPTREFARARLGTPSGKAEAYVILATRPEVADPYLYLGFQRPPSREQLRAMIERQDMAGLEACFDRIPVRPGDCLVVPGGRPHALGEGLMLLEIMEPSDLAVRFEFARGGAVLPEAARFMGRDLDFCLDVFDLSPISVDEVWSRYAARPRILRTFGERAWLEEWIGPELTPCFRVRQGRYGEPVRRAGEMFIGVVLHGRGRVRTAREVVEIGPRDRFWWPAGLEAVIEPDPTLTILECTGP